ncbi:uncharacterized protein [Arachis hypogaea]|uniref:uncharacterized protein n=1 Tax=Arachis hypogaea TaxID=3818 RepID=UPI0007AF3162
MDKVFSKQIGRNLEVYVDDMVVKSQQDHIHDTDLEEVFNQVRKHSMRLNTEKCAFGVNTDLGFMLTARGIEANLEKCDAIINMRSPRSIKEIQQLNGRLAALSRFIPAISTHSQHFFHALKKQTQFNWNTDCETAFQKLKTMLSSPPILQKPSPDSASNAEGSGAGVYLTNKHELQTEQLIRFTFQTSNNQAEYEALLAGLQLAQSLNITHLQVYCDSQLVVQQVTGHFQDQDWRTPYKSYIQTGSMPATIKDPRTFKRRAASFTLIGTDLYKRDFSQPLLRCLSTEKAKVTINETHEGLPKARTTNTQPGQAAAHLGEHPQTNGLAEAANKVILTALKKKLGEAKGEWADLMPEILWSYNTAKQSTTQETPYRLVYGADAVIPVEIAVTSRRTANAQATDNANTRQIELDTIEEDKTKAELRHKAMQQITQ